MEYLNKYAAIVQEICRQIEPGKKMLQKLMYLMERRGVNLDLNYSIHFFGPYSAKLDNALHTLESYDKVDIDTSGMTHIIRLGNEPISGELPTQEQEQVAFVLENFMKKAPLELEAITTLDYAATKILKGTPTDEQIIAQVRQIKGSKFTIEYLTAQLGVLKQTGYLH